jgi:integrase
MARPVQDVRVHNIQDRRSTKQAKKPWIVRITIDGREKGKAFRTRAEADRYRMLLLRAVEDGERFDPALGEPKSWQPSLRDELVHRWARDWVSIEWPEWQPRTRASTLESLSRFVPLVVVPDTNAPEGLRRYLQTTLAPGTESALDPHLEAWLDSHCLPLVELDRTVLARADEALGLKLDGSFLAPSTARRFRIIARACLRAAVDAGALPTDPWPTRSRNRAQRKVARNRPAVNIRTLPGPAAMARAIDAIETHQPGSATYRVMTAVAYYGGLRPSEVVMLRLRSLDLQGEWGSIEVAEADISHDEPGAPKTGTRVVPIPPVLVEILRAWVAKNAFAEPTQLLFRTRTGRLPTPSNWSRAWHRALESVGERPLRVYDCRHAAATTWLQAGVPLGETARRLGHSVETLVSTYVGALDGDVQLANARIEAVLAQAEPTN